MGPDRIPILWVQQQQKKGQNCTFCLETRTNHCLNLNTRENQLVFKSTYYLNYSIHKEVKWNTKYSIFCTWLWKFLKGFSWTSPVFESEFVFLLKHSHCITHFKNWKSEEIFLWEGADIHINTPSQKYELPIEAKKDRGKFPRGKINSVRTPPISRKSNTTVIWHVTTDFYWPGTAAWARSAHNLATESQVTVQVYRLVQKFWQTVICISNFWVLCFRGDFGT